MVLLMQQGASKKPRRWRLQWDFDEVMCAVKRRRLLFVMAVCAAAGQQSSGPQGPKVPRVRFDWDEFVQHTPPIEFRQMFLMDLGSFTYLGELLGDNLRTKDVAQAARNDGEISPEVRRAFVFFVEAFVFLSRSFSIEDFFTASFSVEEDTGAARRRATLSSKYIRAEPSPRSTLSRRTPRPW
jgi:hypothetical protein